MFFADILWFLFLLPIAVFGGLACVVLVFAVIGGTVALIVEIMDARSVRSLSKPRSDRMSVGE